MSPRMASKINLTLTGWRSGSQVFLDGLCGIVGCCESSVNKDEGAVAEVLDRCHIVTDEEYSPSLLRHVLHFTQTLFLERRIADGQDLVYD